MHYQYLVLSAFLACTDVSIALPLPGPPGSGQSTPAAAGTVAGVTGTAAVAANAAGHPTAGTALGITSGLAATTSAGTALAQSLRGSQQAPDHEAQQNLPGNHGAPGYGAINSQPPAAPTPPQSISSGQANAGTSQAQAGSPQAQPGTPQSQSGSSSSSKSVGNIPGGWPH